MNTRLKFNISLYLVLCAFSGILSAQAIPQVHARFANPTFDAKSNLYFVDAEFSTSGSSEFLYAMNLRFFYDFASLEYQFIDHIRDGYGILGDAPKGFVGNEALGIQLFGFGSSAGYVSGTIHIMDDLNPVEIFPGKWVKLFRIAFKLADRVRDEKYFCPSIIWDKKSDPEAGGFLPGSDGLVITVMEFDPNTPQTSTYALEVGVPFNWQYRGDSTLPYGQIDANVCISVAHGKYIAAPDVLPVNTFIVFQNQPNPFEGQTTIEFMLPSPQVATLVIYDREGRIVDEIKGAYSAGRHKVLLQKNLTFSSSDILYYRLITDEYISEVFKMTRVRS